MTRVSQEFGDRLHIQVINGGMIPRDLPLQTLFSSFADPVALHARISSMSGQVFGWASEASKIWARACPQVSILRWLYSLIAA